LEIRVLNYCFYMTAVYCVVFSYTEKDNFYACFDWSRKERLDSTVGRYLFEYSQKKSIFLLVVGRHVQGSTYFV
jgi:hypothetical protein